MQKVIENNIEFYICDSDSSTGRGILDSLGIHFYNEDIYLDYYNFESFSNKIESYKFNLRLQKSIYIDDRKISSSNSERFEIVITCSLKDLKFIKRKVSTPFDDNDEEEYIYYIDWNSFLTEKVPEVYKFHKQRFFRKINKIIPEIRYIETDYCKGKEFIKVDNFSNFYGNFKQNGIEGVRLSLYERHDLELENIVDFNISYYDLSFKLMNNFSEEEFREINKLEFLKSLSKEDLYSCLKKYFRKKAKHLKDNLYLYVVHVGGNDDISYSAYFPAKEKAIKEMNFLRMMQPISLEYDLLKRGYEFTN